MTLDLRPYRAIAALVWPLALGMVNNAVMQFVDRAYLARFSMAALEAVLPATTLAWVFMCFFQSVTGYAGVFVAQYHGKGDTAGCVRSYRAGLLLALAAGLCMLPLVPVGRFVFSLTAATPALAALESSYYDISILGGVFVFVQMAAMSYFTGRGLTRLVFWVNLGGNLLNIALDPLLIFGWGPIPAGGLAGAAIATVFSLAAQCAVLVILAHRAVAREGRASSAPKVGCDSTRAILLRILRFGIPAGGYEILNMLSFTIFVFVTGRVGEVSFAVSNACFTVNYLLFAPMTGFATGAQTLVGQWCGRGDTREAALALRRTLVLALVFVGIACGAVLLLHCPILSLFAPAEPAARAEFIALGVRLLGLMALWMLFDSADIVLSGALKGAGDTKFVFWWMLVCSFGLWLPGVFVVLASGGDMFALWATLVAYVLVIFGGTALRWRRGTWRRLRLVS